MFEILLKDEICYYLYNAHEDVTGLLSAEGEIKATYEYDAFGTLVGQIGEADNYITYAGYQYDFETGLYYLNARYYDSTIARFITEDTYEGEKNDPLSLNRYTYCSNQPLTYYDPSGHIAISIIAKFSTGAIINIGVQFVANYFFNEKTMGDVGKFFKAINWWQVIRLGFESFIPSKGSELRMAAITGLFDVVVNWMTFGNNYSVGQALKDFAVGFVGDLASRYLTKYGPKAIAVGFKKMGVDDSSIKKLTGIA